MINFIDFLKYKYGKKSAQDEQTNLLSRGLISTFLLSGSVLSDLQTNVHYFQSFSGQSKMYDVPQKFSGTNGSRNTLRAKRVKNTEYSNLIHTFSQTVPFLYLSNWVHTVYAVAVECLLYLVNHNFYWKENVRSTVSLYGYPQGFLWGSLSNVGMGLAVSFSRRLFLEPRTNLPCLASHTSDAGVDGYPKKAADKRPSLDVCLHGTSL